MDITPDDMARTDWWQTLDGAEISDGLYVWDYDLRRAVVDVTATFKYGDEFWDGWFEMRSPDGGRSSTMNGERMWVRHPHTGEPAEALPQCRLAMIDLHRNKISIFDIHNWEEPPRHIATELPLTRGFELHHLSEVLGKHGWKPRPGAFLESVGTGLHSIVVEKIPAVSLTKAYR